MIISRMHLVAFCYAIVAGSCGAALAIAQTGGVERLYKIEAVSFKAVDETGIDWGPLNSDEVMVGTFDAKGYTHSREIGNIDSGDTHHFDPIKSCMLPVRIGEVVLGETSVCDDVGEPAPLKVRIELWEQDIDSLFDFCKSVESGGGKPLHEWRLS